MISRLLIVFYKIWHGKLNLRGAGFLLRLIAPFLPGLQRFPLLLPEGHDIIVDFRDMSAFYWLNYLLGDHFEEKGLLTAISSHTQSNSTLWDIGANCGLLSYRLAKETNVQKIYFFEPNSMMFTLAKSAVLPFAQVQGLPYALSDQCRTATLTVPEGKSAMGSLDSFPSGEVGQVMIINCKTGDQLVQDGVIESPQIIKIDTEGHEASVIEGLQEIISSTQPIIFFEHINMGDEEIYALIPKGYKIYTVSDVDGTLKPGFDRAIGHNSALKAKSVVDT